MTDFTLLRLWRAHLDLAMPLVRVKWELERRGIDWRQPPPKRSSA